jgi:CBS domain-containing protein
MPRPRFFELSAKRTTLEDVMTRKVVTAYPSASLDYVRALMLQNRISRVVIVNEYSTPVGIITDKDIMRYKLEKDSKKLEEALVLPVMSKPLVTETEATPVSSCAKRMLASAISSVVVVRGGVVVGIVTKTDLCMFYAMSGERRREVRFEMTARPITVRASQSIVEAARIMSEKNISRLPVVDGHLDGIVTASDLTTVNPALSPAANREKPRDVLMWEKLILPKEVGPQTVADIMTRNPITVLDTSYLSDAAKLMIFHHISGLPVLDENDRLVGIVTKTDVTRALANMK